METLHIPTRRQLLRRLSSADYEDWVIFNNWREKERERQRQIAQQQANIRRR